MIRHRRLVQPKSTGNKAFAAMHLSLMVVRTPLMRSVSFECLYFHRNFHMTYADNAKGFNRTVGRQMPSML